MCTVQRMSAELCVLSLRPTSDTDKTLSPKIVFYDFLVPNLRVINFQNKKSNV